MAESKVLTAEEAFIKTYNIEPGASTCVLSKPVFVKGFCEGKEQGRLEMRLELKPLVGACLEIRKLYYPHIINDKESHAKAMNVLLHATKNIKTLEAL